MSQSANEQQTYEQPYEQAGPAGGRVLSPQAERQYVCAAHWSPLASVAALGLTWVGPLVVLVMAGDRSPRVRRHAVDALNFQITTWIAMLAIVLVSLPLMLVLIGFVTIWLALVVPVVALVVHAIAAAKVAGGDDFTYPFTLRLIT